MASIDTVFCRLVLRDLHKEVRKTFPEIKNVRQCAGVTSTMRGQFFVQIGTPNRPMFNFDCRAYSATDARCKAWRAFLTKYAPQEASDAV